MNWIKSKVVMLPTNEKAVEAGTLVFGVGKFLFHSRKASDIGSLVAQHLYFTSDEEIKEGDWSYNDISKKITQNNCSKNQMVSINANEHNKKIIATTDKSLYNEILPFEPMERIQYKYLPNPSKEFLEVYVKAYNEGKKIENVLIESIRNSKYDIADGGKYEFIKVKSDNTITIKKVKDSWNREEVIELLNKLGYDIAGNGYILDVNLKVKQSWIERNL